MKRIWLLAFYLALAISLRSQHTIIGQVEDKTTQSPLSGAHIVVTNTLMTAVSNAQGKFEIRNIRSGIYEIRVTYMGYESHVRQVAVEATTRLNISLNPKNTLADEVVIMATRAGENTPVSFSTIEGNQLQQLNTGRDIPMLLEILPSIVSTSDAGTGIGYTSFRIRGTDMNRINITLNGIPLNDSESHGVWWVDLPDLASSVASIQVQRGVGTSTNGAGAFGASINMITNPINPEAYASIASNYGSFNTWRNTLSFGSGLLSKHFSIDGRFSKISSDGFIDRAFANLGSYNLTAAYVTDKTILRCNVISGSERTYQAWDGVPSELLATNRRYNGIGAYIRADGSTAYYENETDNYKQDHYQLFWSHAPKQNLNLNAGLHYTKGFGYYEQYKTNRKLSDYNLPVIQLPGELWIQGSDSLRFPGGKIMRSDLIRRKYLDNDFYGIVWSANFNPSRWQLNFGGAVNQYFGDHYGRVIWMKFAGQTNMDHQWYFNQGKKTDFNIFAKANWYLRNRWQLYADLQYRSILFTIAGIDDDLRDISREHSFNFLNPKFGVMWEIKPGIRVYGSYASARREPNRSNYTDASPLQPMPTHEKLHNLELGYKMNKPGWYLGANAYYMYYIDQLILTGMINDVGDQVMTNVPESFRRGVEVETSIYAYSWLQIAANMTVSENIINNFTEYVDDWDNWGKQRMNRIGRTTLAFSPSFIFGGQLILLPFKSVKISLHSKYVSKQYIDNTSSEDRTLDPYFISNLFLNYNLKIFGLKETEIVFQVNNLFNASYETNACVYRYFSEGKYSKIDGYFPQAGVHFMAGLRLSL